MIQHICDTCGEVVKVWVHLNTSIGVMPHGENPDVYKDNIIDVKICTKCFANFYSPIAIERHKTLFSQR